MVATVPQSFLLTLRETFEVTEEMTADGVKLSAPNGDQTQLLPHFDTFLQETGHRSSLSPMCFSSDTSSVTGTPACPESVSITYLNSNQFSNTFESSFVLPEFKASQVSNSDGWTSCCSVPPININISWCSDLGNSEPEPSIYNTKEQQMPPGSELSSYEIVSTCTNSSSPQDIKSVACLTANSSIFHVGKRVSRPTKRTHAVSPLSTDNFDLNTIIRTSPTSLVAYVNGARGSAVDTLNEKQGGSYGHLSARKSDHHCLPPNIPEMTEDGDNYYMNRQEHLQNVDDNVVQYYPSSDMLNNVVSDEFDVNTLASQSMKYLEQSYVSEGNAFQNHIVMPQNLLQQYEQEFFTSSGLYNKDMPDGYDTRPAYLNSDDVASLCPQHISETPSVSEYVALTATYDLNEELLQGFDDGMSEYGTCGTAALVTEDEVFCTNPPVVHQSGQSQRDNSCKWIDCSAVCVDRDELVRHIEKAHIDQRKGDDFTCFWQGCPRRHRAFNARYKLLIHMRVHSGEKPNKCTFKSCGKAFSRLENLKIHLRSHTGERPYHCQYPTCTKAFSNSSDRAKHQRTHLDTKPYACQISGCTKRYTDPSSLRKHVKNHGTIEQHGKKRVRGSKEVNVGPTKPLKQEKQHNQGQNIHQGLIRLNSTGCSGSESYSNSSHDGSPRLSHQASTDDDQNWDNLNPCVFQPTNDIFDMKLVEPTETLHLPDIPTFEIGPSDFEYRNYSSDRAFELDYFLNYDDDDEIFEDFIHANI